MIPSQQRQEPIFLKYYIKEIDGQLMLDSCVSCERELPANFVEWFDKDKWNWAPPSRPTMPDGTINVLGGHFRRK